MDLEEDCGGNLCKFHVGRIQRNIEIAEAKKREAEKFGDSPEPKKDRSQHIKRKSLISNEDSCNKHSSEISQCLSNDFRNKAHNKVDIKPKPTAAIFLIGKKLEYSCKTTVGELMEKLVSVYKATICNLTKGTIWIPDTEYHANNMETKFTL